MFESEERRSPPGGFFRSQTRKVNRGGSASFPTPKKKGNPKTIERREAQWVKKLWKLKMRKTRWGERVSTRG